MIHNLRSNVATVEPQSKQFSGLLDGVTSALSTCGMLSLKGTEKWEINSIVENTVYTINPVHRKIPNKFETYFILTNPINIAEMGQCWPTSALIGPFRASNGPSHNLYCEVVVVMRDFGNLK